MKICNTCKKERNNDDFHKHQNRRDGTCRWCVRDRRLGKQKYKRRTERIYSDPLARSARQKVRDAVRSGKIEKPLSCEECGTNTKREVLSAHHYNGYDHPFDIKWVCPGCHGKVHMVK